MAKAKITEPSAAFDGSNGEEKPKTWLNAVHVHGSLAEAKLAVMREVNYAKKGNSPGLSYTYASEADLLAVLRPSLVRHSLVMAPVAVEQVESGDFQSKNSGSIQHKVRLRVTYRLTAIIQGPDGTTRSETEDVTVVGEGADLQDKAGPKAMTMALKYALRQAFLIETGDDPDKYQNQEVVVKMKEVDLALERSFMKFMGAVETAESHEQLVKLRQAYLHERNFYDEQIEQLNVAHGKRLKVLDARQKVAAPPAEGTGK